MRSVLTIISLLVSLLYMNCSGDRSGSPIQVLKNATIFDGNGNSFVGFVIIEGGLISEIGEDIEIPSHAEVIDLRGKYITPGLVDAHVHYFQTGFYDSRPDALDIRDSLPYPEVMAYQKANPQRYHEAYLRSGITAVYDVGGFPWSINLQKSAENDLNAPHVAASGPLITPAPASMINTFNTESDTVMYHLGSEELGRRIVRQNTSWGSTGIKLWALAPVDLQDMSRLNALADEINKSGNQLIVHATNLEGARAAINLGAKVLVHSVNEGPIDDNFIQLMIENKVIMTPTLVVSLGYLKTTKAVLGEPFDYWDKNGVVDEKTRSLLKNASHFARFANTRTLRLRVTWSEKFIAREDSFMLDNLRRLYDAGALLAVGTDAGNPGTLHGPSIYDEMEAMQAAGIAPLDLIVMATRNGAMAMRRLSDFGTLEKGKQADLIVLEKDPSQDIANMRSITHVIRGGLMRPVNEKFD